MKATMTLRDIQPTAENIERVHQLIGKTAPSLPTGVLAEISEHPIEIIIDGQRSTLTYTLVQLTYTLVQEVSTSRLLRCLNSIEVPEHEEERS